MYLTKIVLIERGGNCTFVEKILHAQNAGALAVVIHDNVDSNVLVRMGGNLGDFRDQQRIVPSFFVSLSTGSTLRQDLGAGNTVWVSLNTSRIDRDGYPGGGSGFSSPVSVDIVAFGIAAGIIFGVLIAYFVAYFAYHKYTRRRGKKLVRTIQYHKPAATTTTTMPHGDDVYAIQDVENAPIPLTQTPAQVHVATTANNEEAFSIEVVHADTVPLPPPPTKLRSFCTRCSRKQQQSLASQNANANTAFDLGGTCTICLEDFTEDEMVFLLPCRHLFHGACVNEWLKRHGNCPNCKQELDEAETKSARNLSCCAKLGRCLFRHNFGTLIPVAFICLAVCLVVAFCVIGAT